MSIRDSATATCISVMSWVSLLLVTSRQTRATISGARKMPRNCAITASSTSPAGSILTSDAPYPSCASRVDR